MNLKKITIQHNDGLATSIFILQNLIIIILGTYFMYSFIKSNILLTQDFSLINLSIILLFIIAIFLIREYLKAIYSHKKFIVSNNFLEINDTKYNLNEIYFKYMPTGFSTLLAAKLYLKETDKGIGLFIFSFWGGTILNITPSTFEKIFGNSISLIDETEEESININSMDIDMDKENQEIEQFDKAWYIVYVVFFIPVALILYLMTRS